MDLNSLKSHLYPILTPGIIVLIFLLFPIFLSPIQYVSAETQNIHSRINPPAQDHTTNIRIYVQSPCEQWDSRAVHKAVVIWDQDAGNHKMWFDGISLQDVTQIGLATSDDGITWTKYGDNPVLSGNSGAWDGSSAEHAPFVIKEGENYKMWYEGSGNGMPRQLGYAISSDGIEWFKYAGNPVLHAGPETYDQDVAGHGSVLKDGDTYKLWYHAIGNQGVIIAYATSSDGISWTKQGPVLLPRSTEWDDNGLWGPSVLKLEGVYWMWYTSHSTQGTAAIGLATSDDGVTWNRVGTGPVLMEQGPVGDPHVLYESEKFKMWYTSFTAGVIHYAESVDGVAWVKSSKNPILTPGDTFCKAYLPLTIQNQ